MLKVLLVEDSAVAAKRVKRLLGEDFCVDWVGDLSSAVERAANNDYQAFLFDYSGQGGLGLKLARIVRGMDDYAGVPIILLSSCLTNRIEYAAKLAGVNSCLEKHVSAETLQTVVKQQTISPGKLEVGLKYLETKCVSWREDNAYYQFSPELGKTVKGVSFDDVQAKMSALLIKSISPARPFRVFYDDIEITSHTVKL